MKGFRYKANMQGDVLTHIHSRARPHPVYYKKYMILFHGDTNQIFPSHKLYPKPWHTFVGRGTEMIITHQDKPFDIETFKNIEQELMTEKQKEKEEEEEEDDDDGDDDDDDDDEDEDEEEEVSEWEEEVE